MILASANAAITPGGMALGGWRTRRRRKERVLSCGSVWGRIAPPLTKGLLGGGLFWAFDNNDGDSNRGFKAGTLDVTMLAHWHYDESTAGRGLCPLAGATTSRRWFGQQCLLAGATTSWRQGGWRCALAGATTSQWRVRRCSLAGATTSRRRGGWRCSLAGALTGWQRVTQWCSPTGATTCWQRGHTTVFARWRDDKLAVGRTTVLARWHDDKSAAGRKAQGTPPACNH